METKIRKYFYPLFLVGGFLILFFLNWILADKIPFRFITSATVFILIAIVMYFERKQPYKKAWNKSKGDLASDFVLTILLFPVIINFCQWLVSIYPKGWKISMLESKPLFLQFLIGVLIAELLFYWTHRLSHKNEILWKIHSWHHSVQRVYWMNSGTFNPLDLLLNFLVYCLPFALFAMNPLALEYALFFSAITGLLEHANVDFKAGRLNFIFNTAELHRWHHSVVIKESQRNYGKALSVWDKVFRTYYLPPRRQVEKVGLK